MLGWLLGGWVTLRMAILLTPVVWSIGLPGVQERYVDMWPLRDNGGPPARIVAAAPVAIGPTFGGARRMIALKAPVVAGSGGGMFMRENLGTSTGWTDHTADLLIGSAMSFVRPRTTGGLLDRVARVVAGTEGRASAITAAGAGVPVAPPAWREGRWSGTAWLLWRPEAGSGFAQAPLLGGSQAGARIDYRLTSGRAGQLSLYGRVSRALTGPSSEEGGLGIAFRPGRLPVSLLAERRQRLGPGGRNGFALLVAGGAGPRDIVPRLEAEGYAQAGIVGLPGADGFADGKASLGYRLTAPEAPRRLTLGGSLSGSIQPGAHRIDVGPELRLRLPVGRAGMRLSTEWRERIAGDARPASGPAVTLVADF